MGMRRDDRRQGVREPGRDQLVEQFAYERDLRIEGNLRRGKRVLLVSQERNVGYDSRAAGRLIEELSSEVGVLAVALVARGVDDALLDVVVGGQEARPGREAELSERLSGLDRTPRGSWR